MSKGLQLTHNFLNPSVSTTWHQVTRCRSSVLAVERQHGLSLGAVKSPLRRSWTSAFEGQRGSCPLQGSSRRAFPPSSGSVTLLWMALPIWEGCPQPSFFQCDTCLWLGFCCCPWTGNEVAMRGWVWTPPVEGHMPPPVSDGRCLQPFPLCPEQHFPHACFLL